MIASEMPVPIVPAVPEVSTPTSFLPRDAGEDEGGGLERLEHVEPMERLFFFAIKNRTILRRPALPGLARTKTILVKFSFLK
ncbi:MAG: hypothetical protein ABIP88_05000, partial [Candidatus Binatia bacterium]